MEKIGHIEIRVSGKKGNLELNPDTLDVRELMSVLEQSEDLLFPGDKKNRPVISYQLEEGSIISITFSISTSMPGSSELTIDEHTRYSRLESVWVDAEFYFYGKITNAGGKDKANIHVLTDEYGTIRIDTPQRILESFEENILYKPFSVRAIGRQHMETGEIERSMLKFVELVDYNPKYDESYLRDLRKKAMGWLN